MTAITPNDNGELIRISSPRQTRSYSYSDTGRLTGVHTTAANWISASRMPRTRQATACPTRSCTGQHPQHVAG
ncbi:hypothetical protein ECZU26_10870 [Escherichia coli]|nr:hypothetical protein ECZU26_10870 [Escherichia coli]